MQKGKDWWKGASLVSYVIQYMSSKDGMLVSGEFRIRREREREREAALL